MVILLFAGQAFKKFNLGFCPLYKVKRKVKLNFFLNLVRRIKISSLDAELNSESNGLVFMDGTYF